MNISEFDFGTDKSGEKVRGIRINNGNGMEISVINHGATLISLKMSDKKGTMEECVLGFDNIKAYEEHGAFFGATIGPVGNRIANARYTLDGKTYKLTANDNDRNHLHGGPDAFDKKIWNMESFEEDNAAVIKCCYLRKDGENNYPGNLKVELQYILTPSNELILEYRAETDKKTPVNLTNHSYWNLSGNKKDNILSHELLIEADTYLPIDEYSIPTGERTAVESTPFDFREKKEIGPAVENTGGFDHNFNLSEQKQSAPVNKIIVEHPFSGRTMEILTTEPGVQFYTAYYLHQLKSYGFDSYEALCLETQMYPDALNHEDFPSIILNPEEIYSQTTIHKFSISK